MLGHELLNAGKGIAVITKALINYLHEHSFQFLKVELCQKVS